MTTRSLGRICAAPIAIALASTAGLLAALVGDGWWDVASWCALGAVVLLCAWYGLPWRRLRH